MVDSKPRRRARIGLRLAVTFLALVISSCRNVAAPKPSSSNAPRAPRSGPYRVVHISDGDTIIVRRGAKNATVRLIGVDAPEVEGPYRHAELGGDESREHMRFLVFGSSVYLETDPQQDAHDRYGRLLAYVYRAHDGLPINAQMIEDGFAKTYRRFRFRERERFLDLEKSAREHRRGLWRAR